MLFKTSRCRHEQMTAEIGEIYHLIFIFMTLIPNRLQRTAKTILLGGNASEQEQLYKHAIRLETGATARAHVIEKESSDQSEFSIKCG